MTRSFRHLLILRGDHQALVAQLERLACDIPGDWLNIADSCLLTHPKHYHVLAQQAKSLLGREFTQAIFDARFGFNLDALAIVSGTLTAGSLLVILLPSEFNHWHDRDSLRWSESVHPLTVPNFITHLQATILQQSQYYANDICCLRITADQPTDYLVNQVISRHWHYPVSFPAAASDEQQHLLTKLSHFKRKIAFITAKRGRGKSALAGMFARYRDCWVTAPNKLAVTTLMQFAPATTQFWAPDQLIAALPSLSVKPQWLIIDEAAMIPLPVITRLIAGFEQVLLTSTLDGYEGTGHGLLLKLLHQYQQTANGEIFSLVKPMRWPEHDPVEMFMDNLLLAHSPPTVIAKPSMPIVIKPISQASLVNSPTELAEFFGLLKTAHYRTSLVDLRRMLDADNVMLYRAQSANQHTVAALITLSEGGLAEGLVEQILTGYRRPKGNLVAQSLVAHAGQPLAAKLRSIRINRIAVQQSLRRQGIATLLVQRVIEQATAQQYDFVSVSYAYCPHMYQMWADCGFKLVHVGSHQAASSGSYALMAIYPLSQAGNELCRDMQTKFARNWYWLSKLITLDLSIVCTTDQSLNAEDKQQLALFASTAYAYSACFAVLYRLANWVRTCHPPLAVKLPLLLNLVDNQFCDRVVVRHFQLAGKKALLVLLRQEILAFMQLPEWSHEQEN